MSQKVNTLPIPNRGRSKGYRDTPGRKVHDVLLHHECNYSIPLLYPTRSPIVQKQISLIFSPSPECDGSRATIEQMLAKKFSPQVQIQVLYDRDVIDKVLGTQEYDEHIERCEKEQKTIDDVGRYLVWDDEGKIWE